MKYKISRNDEIIWNSNGHNLDYYLWIRKYHLINIDYLIIYRNHAEIFPIATFKVKLKIK